MHGVPRRLGDRVPVAVVPPEVLVDGDDVHLRGLVGSLDGERIVTGEMDGKADAAEQMGLDMADDMLARGAKEILDEVYCAENS